MKVGKLPGFWNQGRKYGENELNSPNLTPILSTLAKYLDFLNFKKSYLSSVL